jgi:hypothetical protein
LFFFWGKNGSGQARNVFAKIDEEENGKKYKKKIDFSISVRIFYCFPPYLSSK